MPCEAYQEFVPPAAYQLFMPREAYHELCAAGGLLVFHAVSGQLITVLLAAYIVFHAVSGGVARGLPVICAAVGGLRDVYGRQAYQLLYGPEAYHLLHGRAAYQVFEQYAYQHCMSLVAYIAHGDARGIHDHGAPRGLHDHRAILGLSASMDGRPTKVLWTSGLPCFANPCTLEEVVRLAE